MSRRTGSKNKVYKGTSMKCKRVECNNVIYAPPRLPKKYCSNFCKYNDKKAHELSAEKRIETFIKKYGGFGLEQVHGVDKAEGISKEWSEIRKQTHKNMPAEQKKDISAKISNTLMGHKVSEETRDKISANNKSGTTEVRNKISDTVKELWKDPSFIEKVVNNGSKKFVTGWFNSTKSGCSLYYRSSYELYYFIKLEQDNSVRTFSSCKFSIEYEIDGKRHNYVPDVYVEFIDGSICIVEIKPKSLLDNSTNVVKFSYGKKYCEDRGMKYQVITEVGIF